MSVALRRGDSGAEVEELQKMLNYIQNAGLFTDGYFGRLTERAVKAFQAANGLLIDGAYGVQTETIMLAQYIKTYPPLTATEEEYRDKIMSFIKLMVENKVMYGPGRGLFIVDGSGMFSKRNWLVTFGPGGLGMKKWGSMLPQGPSFHCTSLVNFMLSYLFNRNEKYTHAGNCLQVMTLIENDNSPHMVDPTGKLSPEKYRGFGGRCLRVASDGDSNSRLKVTFNSSNKYMDGIEILDRKEELGLLTLWSQSTKNSNGRWNLDHHVGFLVKALDGELYYFASDGYVSRGKYSCTPICYKKFVPNDHSLYQIFKVDFTQPPESDLVYPIEFER